MALPSTGQLTLEDLAGEFGGTVPHNLSEYYKDGGLVPSSVTTYGNWTAEQFRFPGVAFQTGSTTGYTFWARPISGSGNNIVQINSGSRSGSTAAQTSFIYNGVQEIQRLTYRHNDSNVYYVYSLRYRTVSSSAVNAGVPTTGQINIKDFYGATA